MRVTQRMLVDNLRLNIGRNAENLSDLQTQLSSGKRLQRPSDDPEALSRALSLKSSVDQNAQHIRNISTSRSWLDATDSTLSHLSNILMRARDVALRGASDTQGAEERARLAEQAQGLMEEALQSANAIHEGMYLFAGQRVRTKPFDVDTDPMTGETTVSYNGDSNGMVREIDQGVEFSVNIPGDAAGGGAGGALEKVLSTLDNLRSHLANNSGTDVTADVSEFSDCIERVSNLRGLVGSKVKRLDATESALKDVSVNLEISLSRAQDADIAEVMTKLMMQQNVYQAALAAGARVIQPSLLDFLS